MIVLDEGIARATVAEGFRWYSGAVKSIKELRPNTKIEDESIPTLLQRANQPTFVTINNTDFWGQRAC